MKIENFLVSDDSIAVEYEGNYLDLHNNYSFISFNYNIRTQQVELKWVKNQGEWAEKELYNELKIIFNSVYVFKVNPRDVELPFSEDECLDCIGYLHPDDIELMDGFLTPDFADDSYHLVFGFQSGLFIKIYAETVYLVAK